MPEDYCGSTNDFSGQCYAKAMSEVFYMNFVENSCTSPLIKHESKRAAEKEAERLSGKENRRVFTLKVVSKTQPLKHFETINIE